MMLTLVLLSLLASPVQDARALAASRSKALDNALRGMDLVKLAKAQAGIGPVPSDAPARRCAIRLIEIPADRSIDPKMILPMRPGPSPDRMPAYRGLPPCPKLP